MKQTRILLLALLALTTAALSEGAAFGQGLSQDKVIATQQLQSLEPDAPDLQGFVRFHPAEEDSAYQFSQSEHKWVHTMLPAGPLLDEVHLNVAPGRRFVSLDKAGQPILPGPERNVSTISRGFWSSDGLYTLGVNVTVCASEPFAAAELHHSFEGTQIPWRKLSPADGPQVGDEAWVPATGPGSAMTFRYGRLVVSVISHVASQANRSGAAVPDFPAEAFKAVAYEVLLRASQQAALTGTPTYNAHLAVNGYALPKGVLLVGKQIYVPAQAFAQAMGLTSRWDTKTGALTLSGSGRRTVKVMAGSTVATVGGAASPALKVPVLKQAGQPVMTLDDLLTLTGGRVVGREGGVVRVKA